MEERRALHEQGKRNLEKGARLAGEVFTRKIEQIARDDTPPQMPPEATEQRMTKVHAGMERFRQQEEQDQAL